MFTEEQQFFLTLPFITQCDQPSSDNAYSCWVLLLV